MKSIQEVVQELIIANGLEEAFQFAQIRRVWDANFPVSFTTNVKLKDFQDKVLTFQVVSPVWRKEISLLSDKLITRLNSLLGDNIIEKIILKS